MGTGRAVKKELSLKQEELAERCGQDDEANDILHHSAPNVLPWFVREARWGPSWIENVIHCLFPSGQLRLCRASRSSGSNPCTAWGRTIRTDWGSIAYSRRRRTHGRATATGRRRPAPGRSP